MMWIDWVVWLLLAGWIWETWPLIYGLVRPRRLDAVTTPTDWETDAPLVSVIVPARDEAVFIESALRSLLGLDYPRLEVIAIDDRSTDGTGDIMDGVAATDHRCRVLHVTQLPPGWLGKNHANALGAARAQGEYLLFTDGDVQFAPDTLRHAVAAMRRGPLDHLSVVPDSMMTTLGEQFLMTYFIVQFSCVTRMWLTRFRWARRAFVGIGAFNMIRRDVYELIGGHQPLRMEIADDMMLGKRVKDAGHRQDVLLGASMVRVKWQTGMGGIVKGLEKNAFAAARFSVAMVLAAVVLQLGLGIGPIVLMASGPARIPAAVLAGAMALTHVFVAQRSGYRLLAGLLYPVASLAFCYVLIQSTYRTLRDGGVRWRDTFYPLAELRAGMIEWRPLGGLFRARRRTVRSDQECGPAPR